VAKTTGWDLGMPSPPLVDFIKNIPNKDAAILIPGCGNAHEANYLLEQGFRNVTLIDISHTAAEILKEKFQANPEIKIIEGDFFKHTGQYDVIIEQTFFCALPPSMRQKYVWKMHQLLQPEGILTGLLFNREFESGPPFGGNTEEYKQLFQSSFHFRNLEPALNSITPRLGSELYFSFSKNNHLQVNLYEFVGITCVGCKNTISEILSKIDGVQNVSMSTDYLNVMIVSDVEIPIGILEERIAYENHYKIKRVEIKCQMSTMQS
jgi:SAM-dependent methyltransferase